MTWFRVATVLEQAAGSPVQDLKAQLAGSRDKLGRAEVGRGDHEQVNTALWVWMDNVNDGVSLHVERRTVCGESLCGFWWVGLTTTIK